LGLSVRSRMKMSGRMPRPAASGTLRC
jgi:hypothetical protein